MILKYLINIPQISEGDTTCQRLPDNTGCGGTKFDQMKALSFKGS